MNQPVMDKETIKSILPHRDPMLLVDEVVEWTPFESIETTFYVDPAWDIFRGHFPGDPVLPGVLSVECMGQAADILLMKAEKYAGKTPLFIGIDGVKFKKKITPGSTIHVKARIAKENTEKAIITCESEIFLDGQLAVSGMVTLAMR